MLVPCLQLLHAHAATTARKLMQQRLQSVQNVTRAQNAAQTQLLAALILQHAATLQHVLHAKRLILAARLSNWKAIRRADSYAGRYCSKWNSIFFYACDLCHFIKWFRKAAIWCHLCDCQKAHCRVNSSVWYCQVCFEVHQVCQVLFRHGAEVRVLRYLQGGNSEGGGCRSEQWQIPLLDWHPNTSKYPLQWDDKFFHISDWRWYTFYF